MRSGWGICKSNSQEEEEELQGLEESTDEVVFMGQGFLNDPGPLHAYTRASFSQALGAKMSC